MTTKTTIPQHTSTCASQRTYQSFCDCGYAERVKEQDTKASFIGLRTGTHYDENHLPIKPIYRSRNVEQAIAHIVEECGELLAAYGKAKRWGWQSVNPELSSEQQETNQEWFIREFRDLKRAMHAYELLRVDQQGAKWD